MPFLQRDGIRFHYREEGQGQPFFFQHGLGGDVDQPFGLFSPPAGVRLLALDCRAHGQTRPLGDPDKIRIASYADDLLALMDHLALSRAVVGGISLGAAVALNFALRFPDRLEGLILSRPAWLNGPMEPRSVEVSSYIARLIRQYGAEDGLSKFKASDIYLDTMAVSPDSANSLAGQFENPRAEETVIKLERLPQDAPNLNRDEWKSIMVPTLVLANRQDPVHPFEYGEILIAEIPGAEFRELTAKSVSKEQHTRDVQRFIETFLSEHFL